MALLTDDYLPGDPVNYVVGKREEKAARVHRKLGPKPSLQPTEKSIKFLMRARMIDLEPAVEEARKLNAVLEFLKTL